jgi:hypothetical protein
VIGVVEDADIVAVPIPIAAVAGIDRRDVEVITTEPEPSRAASLQAPDMPVPETAVKTAVLPGVVDMEADILAPVVVTDPLSVAMDMRSFGMIVTIATETLVRLVGIPVVGCRTVVRNVSATHIMMVTMIAVIAVLREGWQAKDHVRC